ncbi:MAG: exodeoxyribonuclease VII small subunit [Rhodothalassiaceae bacterium]
MSEKADRIPADIAAMSFEEALKELEAIVSKLETGEASLEDSIDIYTRGTWLKRHCEEKLKRAEARIEKISADESGAVTTEAFDVE